MGKRTSLVMGASGYLGSHVTRQLVKRGDDVRVWIRRSSSTAAFDDLDVQRCYGNLTDDAALRAAMRDVDEVHYCIVDTRAWLRDPAPLFEANVAGLKHVLEAAVHVSVPRFVFCSTVGTIGLGNGGPATEDAAHDWLHLGGPYIKSRHEAEQLVLGYARDRGLPAVVLCVATTYGPKDLGPSPHGQMLQAAALGRMPVYVRGSAMEVVGVEDAARAFLLAADRGRVGERYIVSERLMSMQELFTHAAEETGHRPPRWGVPMRVIALIGRCGDVIGPLFRRDPPLNSVSVRLMHVMPALDHSKAVRELGWQPQPAAEAVRAGARYFADQRR